MFDKYLKYLYWIAFYFLIFFAMILAFLKQWDQATYNLVFALLIRKFIEDDYNAV